MSPSWTPGDQPNPHNWNEPCNQADRAFEGHSCLCFSGLSALLKAGARKTQRIKGKRPWLDQIPLKEACGTEAQLRPSQNCGAAERLVSFWFSFKPTRKGYPPILGGENRIDWQSLLRLLLLRLRLRDTLPLKPEPIRQSYWGRYPFGSGFLERVPLVWIPWLAPLSAREKPGLKQWGLIATGENMCFGYSSVIVMCVVS